MILAVRQSTWQNKKILSTVCRCLCACWINYSNATKFQTNP